MSLSDKETLELNELCSALADGHISESQKARLSECLKQSEDARQFYVRYMGLAANLHEYASEMQSEAPEPVVVSFWQRASFHWGLGSVAAAAVLVVGLWLGGWLVRSDVAEPDAVEVVAHLTGAKDCRWNGLELRLGDHLRRGQVLDLASGAAEITFDCGAQVTLEAPTVLNVNSAWDATLSRGTLRANVPHEAIGFHVAGPSVNVVDLGTEFSMVADRSSTEVFVLKGAVQAAMRDDTGTEHEPVLLKEKQSKRFARSGTTDVFNPEIKLRKLARQIKLDQFSRPIGFVHWGFDELSGRIASAETLGMSAHAFDAKILSDSKSGLHSAGQFKSALSLDGHAFAKAPFPGLSAGTSRTVACWVKVPQEAPLSDAGAILSWGGKRAGSPNVQILWNTNPSQGALGALRTDVNRSCVVGTTSLRDGQWHHIAVVYVPPERGQKTTHIKQYVDGRLESVAAVHVRKRRSQILSSENADDAIADMLWIGRPLAKQGVNKDRFHGEIDELFITDRSLTPKEIVVMMRQNKPPEPPAIAAQ